MVGDQQEMDQPLVDAPTRGYDPTQTSPLHPRGPLVASPHLGFSKVTFWVMLDIWISTVRSKNSHILARDWLLHRARICSCSLRFPQL